MELLKVQQQCVIVPKGHPAPTVADVARSIIRQRGIIGLYRGFFPTTMRETGYGAYFGVYEGMLMLLAKISSGRYRDLDPSTSSSEAVVSKAKHSTLDFMLAGGFASCSNLQPTLGALSSAVANMFLRAFFDENALVAASRMWPLPQVLLPVLRPYRVPAVYC